MTITDQAYNIIRNRRGTSIGTLATLLRVDYKIANAAVTELMNQGSVYMTWTPDGYAVNIRDES